MPKELWEGYSIVYNIDDDNKRGNLLISFALKENAHLVGHYGINLTERQFMFVTHGQAEFALELANKNKIKAKIV